MTRYRTLWAPVGRADPPRHSHFLYGDGKPHCWSGPVNQGDRLNEMAQHILGQKPDWATAPWWTW